MGKRQRKRAAAKGKPRREIATSDYADGDGNVLTLRNELTGDTSKLIRELEHSAAATTDDAWQRRSELLFERFAVRWTIAGLPLEGQKELLGRYRLADEQMRRWVRQTIDAHVLEHVPELAGS